jgi:protein TonB
MMSPVDIAELRRWLLCAAVIVLAHAGLAGAMVTWHEADEGRGPAAGVVIEFAPVPVAPATFQSELPSSPEQYLFESAPSVAVESPEEKERTDQIIEAKLQQKVEEKVETRPVEEPPLEASPAPNPEVMIEPPPPQEVQQEAPRPQLPSPLAVATAPDVIAEETAAVPAAPRQGAPNRYDAEVARSWHKKVSTLIESKKRYPASAQARGQQGVVKVAFSVDRQGRIVDTRLEGPSGVAALDEEALAVLRRAEPFPPPPAVVPGDRFTFIVPLRFIAKK